MAQSLAYHNTRTELFKRDQFRYKPIFIFQSTKLPTEANNTIESFHTNRCPKLFCPIRNSNAFQVWTCAPRFQRAKEKQWAADDIKSYKLMLGHCFVYGADDALGVEAADPRRVIPLEDKPVFFGRPGFTNEYAYGTAYAEMGMSMHALEDGSMMFGAPGAWNWTGSTVV